MIPMSSSPAHNAHRRKQKRPLARSNSSLFGTIKNIVTAPLAWFASTDFEDSADAKGKRRRLAPESTHLSEQDEGIVRKKRLRVYSPDREQEQERPVPKNGPRTYLDPPSTVFQQQYQPTNHHVALSAHSNHKPTTVPDFPRNASTTINLQNRSTLSPLRSALSRTMSIDPPSRPLSRESAVTSTLLPITRDRDTSMDPFIRPSISLNREKSMPPLSGRPSFRMRTSMTPQPSAPREISEPPALKTLHSSPMFIRAPQTSEPHRFATNQRSSATLGSLVDSQRRTHSPVRQHSSLLFGTANLDLDEGHRHQSPAERALHELDIYKTPLLPSRLRSSKSIDAKNILAPTTHGGPDMFKSRRASNLVLMEDDEFRPNRFGRKVSNQERKDIVNDTKPYAGEGGVKRLLARRKQEVSGGSDDGGSKLPDEATHQKIEAPEVAEPIEPHVPVLPPSPPRSDWYAVASSGSVASSSLRVGRTKASRNHIARPAARPMKTKFSAAYEDDGDDVMDGGEEHERRQEYDALEAAAKQAPIFNIPPGFSFAKENSVERATSPIIEPPIPSLPFSLTKQYTTQPTLAAGKTSPAFIPSSTSKNPAFQPFLISPTKQDTSDKPQQPTEPDTLKPSSPPSFTTSIPAAPAAPSGVPNFFATSSAFSKPLHIVAPAFNFAPTPPDSAQSTDLAPAATPLVPDKSKENILSDGNDKKDKDDGAPSEQWYHGNIVGTNTTTPLPPANSAAAIQPIMPDTTANAQLPSSFPLYQPSNPSAFIPASHESKPLGAPDLVNPRAPSARELAPSALFDSPQPTSTAQRESPKSTNSSIPFQFGPTTSAAPEVKSMFVSNQLKPTPAEEPKPLAGPIIEAPKPLFGATNAGFRFGEPSPEKPRDAQITTFSFGASPSTPPIAKDKKEATFSFGPLAPAAALPQTTTPFSFAGSGSATSDVTPKPFIFGIPSAATPPPPRPATPKNQDQEFRMEESPTRELQANNNPGHTSTFSFGPNPSNHTFGGSQPTTATPPPFPFGGTTTPNPFAKDANVKPEESKPAFGFGQAPTPVASNPAPGFSFGRNTTPITTEPPRPSSTGSFFGTAPTSATGTGPSFAFGAPSIQATASFGQPAASAPSSPSTFNQASPFTFAPPMANSFSFGSSQPASPAGGVSNLTLPQPATPVGFGNSNNGFGQVSQSPSSPFGPTPIASSTSSGGTLFTIGAAPAPAPGSGNRAIRKLPNRRGGGLFFLDPNYSDEALIFASTSIRVNAKAICTCLNPIHHLALSSANPHPSLI
ncbi:hypothetical protein BD779DRAFT_1668917 [Infundibulicybe gibba]|nr:hypothetical protein BD779DRAFT_1668917 [Infundibulicybe gibba]